MEDAETEGAFELDNILISLINIPQEIITEILLRLPAKSLLRFRCVSKSWLFLISSYKFAKAHLKILRKNNVYARDKLLLSSETLGLDLYTCSIQSIIEGSDSAVQVCPTPNHYLLFDRLPFYCSFAEPRKFLVLGSCNGLVLVFLPPNIIVLWNPTTRTTRWIPQSVTGLGLYYLGITFGFGYDEPHDDYKVVQCVQPLHEYGVYKPLVKVYSLRTNSWKALSKWPGGDASNCRPGNFLNGSLHWLDKRDIVCLDLSTDTLFELPLPNNLDIVDALLDVAVLGGCLAMYCAHHVDNVDIWVMKEYGVRESWARVVRIPFSPPEPWVGGNVKIKPRPLFLWADGKILMNYGSSLKIYDPNDPHRHRSETNSILNASTYVESLVSLTLDDEEEHD